MKFLYENFFAILFTCTNKYNSAYKNKSGLLPTCTCGGNNEIEWVQQYFSNRTRLFEIYSKFEGK